MAISIDSRGIGPVPTTELVGRVKFVIPARTPPLVLGLDVLVAILATGVFLIRRRDLGRGGYPR